MLYIIHTVINDFCYQNEKDIKIIVGEGWTLKIPFLE